MLNAALSFFTTIYGALAVSCAIVLWGFIAYLRFKRQFKPLVAEFEKHLGHLLEVDTKQQFSEFFSEKDELFRTSSLLGHSWQEFTDILIFPIAERDELKVLNATPPDNFFNRQSLLEPRINLRYYNALPNLLTGAGILGTFIGLVIGIFQASGGLSAQDIAQVQAALKSLLGGASLAFMTSIAGLLASIAFSLWEKKQIHHFDRVCNAWVEALDDRLERVTQEKLARLTLHETQQQRTALEQFGNDLVFQMASAFDNNVTAKLSPVLHAVLDELIGMRNEQRQASDETLERLLRDFSEKISASAGKELKELGGTLSSLSRSLETNINNLAENQKRMQDNTETSIGNLTKAFTENSANLTKTLGDGVSEMVTRLKATVEEMASILRAATVESTENMRQIVERFDASVAKLRQSIAEIHSMTTQTQSINEDMRNLLQAITSAEQKVASLTDTFHSTSELLNDASDKLTTSAANLDSSNTSIESAASFIRDCQKELSQNWLDYCERFESVDKDLANTLQTLQAGLSEYAESTNRYVVGLDEHASKITQNLASAAKQLEDSIETLIEEMPRA